jgi:hypothetical protein
VWIGFGAFAQASFDWILVKIVAADIVVRDIADAVVSKSSLPNRELRRETMRETAFDELHGTLDGDVCGCDEEVKVIWHDNVGMQQVAGTVVVDCFKEEGGVALDLEESAAVVGGCGNEVSASFGGAARDRHSAIVKRTSAAEAAFLRLFSTAKQIGESSTRLVLLNA